MTTERTPPRGSNLPLAHAFPHPREPAARRRAWLFIGAALAVVAGPFRLAAPAFPARAAPATLPASPSGAGPAPYDARIRPFLARHCLECHNERKTKGDLRLDQLAPDFADDASREHWRAVAERVKAGQMPPKAKPRPPAEDVRAFANWVDAGLRTADAARRAAQGRVVLRRLNRVAYENTVRDLLGVEADLKEMLPLDTAADGFDNVGDALHTSSFLMERYLAAADTALDLAITNRPAPPPSVKKRYSLQETHQVKSTTENVFRKSADGGVTLFTSSAWQAVGLSQFYPSERGRYRFRISASAVQSGGESVVFRVTNGGGGMGGAKAHLVGYFDAPAGEPAVVEFVDRVEPRTMLSILPYGLPSAQAVHNVGAEVYEGPGLSVQWVEVEGPLNDAWPPESHRRFFGDLPQGPAPDRDRRDRVEVIPTDPKNPAGDADRVLRPFVRRAFRRPVKDADVAPFVALVKTRLSEGDSFEQAVRAGLAAVMMSPDFLFLRERPGRLDDFALASRLSYFLWSTMPDEELLAVAGRGELGRPEKLHGQVERMLRDPRAAAFAENFVGQWLGLRDIDFTLPSSILYPEFDDMLKASMVREAELFFAEVLKDDLSLTNFVASDFTMLNGRLAKHYGIPGVSGWAFRKVALPPGTHRGGVLTMAGVLKVTANGTTTSPVTRGAWVLQRILGTPPPRPPENVAALEPDVRGATTVRQELAEHRQIESCASCHVKIDPPGFALESFDVIGGWRDYYRSSGNGKTVTVDGRRMPYLQGPKVDPSDVLPDGRAFRDVDEFKQLLLADKDPFARALTSKLLTYATGGPPDQPQVDAIVANVRQKKYGFRSLIHEIVASELFQSK